MCLQYLSNEQKSLFFVGIRIRIKTSRVWNTVLNYSNFGYYCNPIIIVTSCNNRNKFRRLGSLDQSNGRIPSNNGTKQITEAYRAYRPYWYLLVYNCRYILRYRTEHFWPDLIWINLLGSGSYTISDLLHITSVQFMHWFSSRFYKWPSLMVESGSWSELTWKARSGIKIFQIHIITYPLDSTA